MKRLYTILLFMMMVLVHAPQAHALILTPAADGGILDGYVYSVGFTSKDGIADQIDPLQSVQVYNNSAVEERGIIEFNVSGFHDPLSSALLRLPVIDQKGPYPLHLELYGYHGNGILDSADFNAGSSLLSFTYNGESAKVFDVTSFILNAKALNADYAGFNIRLLDVAPLAPGLPYVAFGSNEFPQSSQLLLNEDAHAVPEPMTVVLFGLGLSGLFFIRRSQDSL